jgi:hypothetical protein
VQAGLGLAVAREGQMGRRVEPEADAQPELAAAVRLRLDLMCLIRFGGGPAPTAYPNRPLVGWGAFLIHI